MEEWNLLSLRAYQTSLRWNGDWENFPRKYEVISYEEFILNLLMLFLGEFHERI